jgi:hypothetical protein
VQGYPLLCICATGSIWQIFIDLHCCPKVCICLHRFHLLGSNYGHKCRVGGNPAHQNYLPDSVTTCLPSGMGWAGSGVQ